MELKSKISLYYPGNMPNKLEWSTMSENMWGITVSVKFSKQKDSTITIFEVIPPINTPRKLRKELSFKTNSYKELRKWLKKNEKKVGLIKNLGI